MSAKELLKSLNDFKKEEKKFMETCTFVKDIHVSGLYIKK